VTIAEFRFFVDVTVRHSLSPSYLRSAGATKLAVARMAERSKQLEQSVLAERAGGSFVPFVIETTGGFGPGASEFLSRVRSLVRSRRLAWVAGHKTSDIYHAVSVAVQSGNARLLSLVIIFRRTN
jgi:hypothetical protein